jgi:hypothetical protein
MGRPPMCKTNGDCFDGLERTQRLLDMGEGSPKERCGVTPIWMLGTDLRIVAILARVLFGTCVCVLLRRCRSRCANR